MRRILRAEIWSASFFFQAEDGIRHATVTGVQTCALPILGQHVLTGRIVDFERRVVSDTPLEVYDPTRENVLAHEKVNEAVMRQRTVIPMSFGTVFKTRDDIVELLRGAYDAFRDVLNKMEDKLEFGLKILWDRDVMIREIEKQDEDVR